MGKQLKNRKYRACHVIKRQTARIIGVAVGKQEAMDRGDRRDKAD